MAPTLNCTVGDPAANSYVCLDEAEEIAANIPGGDEWIALTEEEKIFSLIAATALLETLQYRGEICSTSQRPEVAAARRRLRRTTLRLLDDSVQD